jgi:hypothetical protein
MVDVLDGLPSGMTPTFKFKTVLQPAGGAEQKIRERRPARRCNAGMLPAAVNHRNTLCFCRRTTMPTPAADKGGSAAHFYAASCGDGDVSLAPAPGGPREKWVALPSQLTTDHCQLTTAKICREKGIEYARRLLGHANISTTQRYMHLDDRELADAQDLVE